MLKLNSKHIKPASLQNPLALIHALKNIILEREGLQANTLTTSRYGIAFIEQNEGLSLLPYKDSVGVLTIGYGHAVLPGENFSKGITLVQADALLRKDVAKFEQIVNSAVKVKLNQNQFDALVDLAYNIGEWNFRRSTLVMLLNQGNYQGAADQFLVWCKANINGHVQAVDGLLKRRQRERTLFLMKVA